MTKSSRIYFSFVQAIQVIKKTRSALIRALLVLLFMQTKGKSNPFSAARRKPIKCHTKPTRLTENGSVCSAALPIRWIFCPLTAPATAVLCQSWYIQSLQKSTFWTMNQQQGSISYRSGQKQWRFTAAETSSSDSARQ